MPEVIDVVRIAANLFVAGQETTVRLFGTALQLLGDDPELQHRLRDDRELIPNFVEECLRIESPVKGDFRLARKHDDGRRRRDPGRHDRDGRQRGRQPRSPPLRVTRRVPGRAGQRPPPLAFGLGVHTCPGAPLARAEGRVTLERLLDRMADIRISEAHHGPAGARRYHYVPTYILRGVSRLHLGFEKHL